MFAEYVDNKILIHDSYMHRESIKEIHGRLWDPDKKVWSVPATEENLITLDLLGCTIPSGLMERVKPMKPASVTSESAMFPMPIKVNPYQHQVKAFNFVCRLFGLGGELCGYQG